MNKRKKRLGRYYKYLKKSNLVSLVMTNDATYKKVNKDDSFNNYVKTNQHWDYVMRGTDHNQVIDNIPDILEKITVFDYSYIILTILLMIRGAFKGFVLSILSAAKWVLAYILTIFIFPKAKPYVENILDNEYVLDIILGVSLFVLIIFLILMINKAISKAVTYSGIGTIDKFFGLIFGIVKSYVFVVCLFTAANIVYNYEKWPLNLKDSFTFPMVEKGSKYLIREFPNEKEYQDAKEKVHDI